ncbi:MAG: hypothetical protein KKI08_02440 [Armatimonadetes bacterium]|nr:hypothetical protein [Armatimonadota bacterium]
MTIRAGTPPPPVNDAFQAVAGARVDRDRIMDTARDSYDEAVAQAQGETGRMLQEAEGQHQRVMAEAEGDATWFRAIRAEYVKAATVTRDRLCLEAREEIVPRMRVIVSDSADGRRPLDLAIVGSQPPPASPEAKP